MNAAVTTENASASLCRQLGKVRTITLWVQRCNYPLPASIRLILRECVVSSHWPWPARLGSEARMFRKRGGRTTFCSRAVTLSVRGASLSFAHLSSGRIGRGSGGGAWGQVRRGVGGHPRGAEESEVLRRRICVHPFWFQLLGRGIHVLGRRDRVPQTGGPAEVPFPTVLGAQSPRSRSQWAGSVEVVT